jgi:colanic acid biosynthesis glycosyl transferase WcaI
MKILIYGINYSPELTGVGKYTGEMAKWLKSNNFEVRVITALPYYPNWRIYDKFNKWFYIKSLEDDIQVWRCPHYVPSKPNGIKRILHLISFAITSLPIMLAQITWRPDWIVVVEPTFFCLPTTLLVSKLSESNSWLHIQDFEIDAAFSLGLVKFIKLKKMLLFFELYIMKHFSMISTISDSMLSRLKDKNIAEKSLYYLPNWTDIENIEFIKRELLVSEFLPRHILNIPSNSTLLLYSGNIGEKQGVELIVQAAMRLQSKSSLYFIICGDGSALNRIKKLGSGLSNIIWLKPLCSYDFTRLLCDADIHLLPQSSLISDLVMPSKLTAIFASGRPVIATANVGTSLYKSVIGRGLAVPPENLDLFVDAIVMMSEDKSLRSSLGAAAFSFASEHFSKHKILTRFGNFLKSSISS